MTDIKITVIGIEKIQAALTKFPREISNYLGYAGNDAARDVVLGTVGLKNYPPMTAANAPPTPYYIRGRGTQTASGNRGESERLGTQWYVEKQGLGTVIGNRASYAHWVHGDDQASFMKPKGWRKLLDVAEEKREKITAIYQKWTDRLIKNLGL
jgi:hypothetical protein